MTKVALQFRKLRRAHPFQRFKIILADGESVSVMHPEFAMISPDGREIAAFNRSGRLKFIDVRHVTNIRPVSLRGKRHR